ncbi:hypothetical protein FNV43_RR17603 [Rhamnella rubrinervis]|uniref:Uncharacterized protein n=1 Tax=Rhamnella rubrinervis TaxID=2594499 RepID=A0A8K0DZ41_9ROSA|nr:hypothetical protein FNV43_RR17603 [Rhamnella rubrinervis]
MSIEALAMAGIDYEDSRIDVEEWKDGAIGEQPPPHLQVEDYHHDDHHEEDVIISNEEAWKMREIQMHNNELKAKMRLWAKAVASMNKNTCT